MKIRMQSKNPYSAVRNSKFNGAKAYLVEILSKYNSEFHLDFGAHDGEFVASLKNQSLISKGVGLDANSDAVNSNKKSMPNGVELSLIRPNEPILFEDDTFSSISIIGVLEHVVEQKKLLSELRRILKPGGEILIAVPGQHLFSFLDMGNWKFMFPRLHEFYVTRAKGADYFKANYSENPDGLYGDVEKEKFWHEHFSKKGLSSLVQEMDFVVIEIDGFGFFNRILANAAFFMPKISSAIFDKLIEWDARFFSSTEIWIRCQKPNVDI